MKMFGELARSVALYGAEIWGWEDEKRLDCLQRKYMKGILGLDRDTPDYIAGEETKMKELRIEAIKRAVRYEEKARRSNKKLVVECFRELDRGGVRGK
ncbi:hypothetical protein KM043_015920 [Ampulex compressa]|nr:hypothetical protein KM043_015920 [Ampulex compressa]